jgi:hypothetical protein
MMADAPPDIRRFETAQIVLMVLALIYSFTINHEPLIDTFVICLFIGLTFLVSRGRKNWARWLLLAIYVLGVLVEIWNWRLILAAGHPVIVAASVVLRGAALVLAFTPQSTAWLRTAPNVPSVRFPSEA